jgi:hypothetical protein
MPSQVDEYGVAASSCKQHFRSGGARGIDYIEAMARLVT